LGLLLSAKGHKTKTTRTPSLAITHHDRVNNVTILRKAIAQSVVGGIPAQFATINL
jgi:hypothetical protein